ncbi:helix-turn-helix domain-containing protein [Phascolarctobacterium sp.]
MNKQKIAINIGRNIKIRRIILGISQLELSKKANINQSHLSLIENGKKIASIPILDKIAIALNSTISDLLCQKY